MRNALHAFFPRLAALLLMALAASAGAQVFKCVDASGKTAYQSQPCPESTKSSQVDVRSVSSLPTLSGIGSASEIRQAVIANCLGGASRSTPAMSRLAAEQPRKFRSFCECTADGVMPQVDKIKEMYLRKDAAGIERLGMEVGLACASRLQ
ncbi:MAG: DUF4124 domain-containing protein [Burkholderiales bacterium]|nr:MAG: DUF4124 domain-containing protein [Burkholderiales bacterium]